MVTEEDIEGAIVGTPHIAGKFFCKRPGGYQEGPVDLKEGTKERGPFYQAWAFSDTQIEKWMDKGIIEMVD